MPVDERVSPPVHKRAAALLLAIRSGVSDKAYRDLCPPMIRDLLDELESLRTQLAAVTAERDEARDWVRRMHRETQVLTCAFCGEAYPPGTPGHNDERLREHVTKCTKHPLRAEIVRLERDLARAVEERDEARAALPDGGHKQLADEWRRECVQLRGRLREIAAAWREREVALESLLDPT